jgi:hypothetical protein
MHKWYERKRNGFEQRRNGKSTEIFVLGIEYFYTGEISKMQ